jgi:ABC-type sulfate/molybdate transport systems ATPase subunit
MVTHDPDEARAAAQHVLFVSGGRIAADAPACGFFERRDLPDLEKYLGQEPSFLSLRHIFVVVCLALEKLRKVL